MSSYLIFCYVVSTFLLIGFLSLFFKGFKSRDTKEKVLVIVTSVIFLGLFVFVNFNEYEKEQDAKKVMEKTEPTYYIKTDTLELYKIDGKHYRYAPRMHQLVFFGDIDEKISSRVISIVYFFSKLTKLQYPPLVFLSNEG